VCVCVCVCVCIHIYNTFVSVKILRDAIILFEGVKHNITFAIHSPVLKCFSMFQTPNKKSAWRVAMLMRQARSIHVHMYVYVSVQKM
jgi:hypothetical protein